MDEKDNKQGPQRVDLARFRAVLQKRNIPIRFKVDKYTEDVPAMLRECYIAEVMRRRMQFIDDEATQKPYRKGGKMADGKP